MNINQNNKFRCWLWFSDNQQGEMYEVLQVMIEDKIKEMVPPLLEKLLRQKFDNLSFNIQTMINGKPAAENIKSVILDMINKEFH